MFTTTTLNIIIIIYAVSLTAVVTHLMNIW